MSAQDEYFFFTWKSKEIFQVYKKLYYNVEHLSYRSSIVVINFPFKKTSKEV